MSLDESAYFPPKLRFLSALVLLASLKGRLAKFKNLAQQADL